MKNIFHILFYIFLFSFTITFLNNPGIPERKYYSKSKAQKNYLKCKKCNIIAPTELNLGHCIDCDICIKGYDHHCSWVGKCIGKGNIIFFYCFILSFLGFILFLIFTIFLFLYQISKNSS